MDREQAAERLRPFYFVVVVWGERYRNYFLEYCLPSLLAPGNIPSLTGERTGKYIMATTAEDWAAMQRTAIFRELERFITPVFVALPPCPPGRPYWMQNIVGHKLCCELIYRDKAYRIFTCPDSMFSDGSVARMHQLALQGSEVVLKLTVPSASEAEAFKLLNELHMLPETSARDTGKPLVFTGRELATVALKSQHYMSIINEWQAPYFCGYAATPWWRVQGEDGIVAFGMFWDVLLIDYAAVKIHNSAILDERGWDGDYNMSIIGDLETMYLVKDTDEINILGWNFLPGAPLRRHPFGLIGKGGAFRKSYNSPSYNNWHRSLFFVPTRVHGGPINEKWDGVEELGLRTILTWADPPKDISRLSRKLPDALRGRDADARIAEIQLPRWRRNPIVWKCFVWGIMPMLAGIFGLQKAVLMLRMLLAKVYLAVRGDQSARQRLQWRVRRLVSGVLGRPFN